MKRLLLLLLPLLSFQCQPAHAVDSGQYRISKRNADGTYTDYGVTIINGQVFGLTAGIPAAITPFSGAFADLSGKPTTLSGYGITNGLVTTNNLSDLVNAATARTNLGLGTAATLAWSDDGDAGAVPVYTLTGGLGGTNFYTFGLDGYVQAGKIKLTGSTSGVIELIVPAVAGSGSISLPANTTGTVINTGDAGTVTNAMLAGSIALSKIAQGGATSGQVLAWNGSAWAPAASGSGLTIGTTAITSGTSGRILYNLAGVVGEMTTSGSGTEVALTNSPVFVTPQLGTPASGTLTNCAGLPAAGVVGTAATLGANTFTSTQQINASSDYWRQTAYASQFYLNSTGVVAEFNSAAITSAFRFSLGALGIVTWQSTNRQDQGIIDLTISREAANTLQIGADANADATDQTFKAADGITGTDRSGADFTLASGRGTGAGAASALIFSTPSALSTGTTAQTLTERARISSSGLTVGTSGTGQKTVKHGVAVLVAGTVTVSETSTVDTGTASTSSRILITRMDDGGTVGDSYSVTRSNGTSFTITSKSAGVTQTLDTSTVSWLLINP